MCGPPNGTNGLWSRSLEHTSVQPLVNFKDQPGAKIVYYKEQRCKWYAGKLLKKLVVRKLRFLLQSLQRQLRRKEEMKSFKMYQYGYNIPCLSIRFVFREWRITVYKLAPNNTVQSSAEFVMISITCVFHGSWNRPPFLGAVNFIYISSHPSGRIGSFS